MKARLALLILLAAVACTFRGAPADGPNATGNDRIRFSQPLPAYAGLDETLLRVLFLSDIPLFTWDAPAQIPARQLVLFYCAAHRLLGEGGAVTAWVHPKGLEGFVRKNFDVPPAHLRDSPYYDATVERYILDFRRRQIPVSVTVSGFSRQGNLVSMDYVYTGEDDEPLMYGSLTWEAGLFGVRFLSCEAKSTYLDTPPQKGRIRIVLHVEGYEEPHWAEIADDGRVLDRAEQERMAKEELFYWLISELKPADLDNININSYVYTYEIIRG